MNIVAILTGKGGSNLKDKNILKINGKPCLYYPCNAAKKVKIIQHYFVSSEDPKILKYAEKYGYKVIKRPKYLSKVNSQHIDVIKHALLQINKLNIKPDIIVVLLANAPIVHAQWINDAINILNVKSPVKELLIDIATQKKYNMTNFKPVRCVYEYLCTKYTERGDKTLRVYQLF